MVSPKATGAPALSGLTIFPVMSGRVEAPMPGCAWPYSQRTRVTYSPAPRPGGGLVRVVEVVVLGELPQRVKTPGAVFFS
jgi:hypothetical protein